MRDSRNFGSATPDFRKGVPKYQEVQDKGRIRSSSFLYRTVVKIKRFATYLREFQKFMSYPAALTKGGQNTSRALCRNDLRPHGALAGMQVLFAKVRYKMYEILKGTLQNV